MLVIAGAGRAFCAGDDVSGKSASDDYDRTDPLTYATVGLTMVGCATLSGLCAARRVRSMTLTEALRTN